MQPIFNDRALHVRYGVYIVAGWEFDFVNMVAYATKDLRLKDFNRVKRSLRLETHLAFHELLINKQYNVCVWWGHQKKWIQSFGLDSDLSYVVNSCYKHFIDSLFEVNFLKP